MIVLAAFVLQIRDAKLCFHAQEGCLPPLAVAILGGLVTGVFASLLYLMLLWRRSELEALLPSADTLDRVTYKTIGIAFPLLTGMIAAGAYWANRTWGSYWSWDPKETWAAITWLINAGAAHAYHARLTDADALLSVLSLNCSHLLFLSMCICPTHVPSG